MEYDGKTFMQCPPLFTHQFSHAWVDFRDRRDATADYWRNSVLATQAHRHFCMHLADRFPKYGPELWGITASNSEKGYVAWGGPPATPQIDGTVVPCAAAGSIPFTPEPCISVLRHMREAYGKRVWKKYGFVDAFNPNSEWTDSNVIGIDVGITLLMAENHRSGFVWRWFMANPEIEKAMALAGFRRTTPKLHRSEERYLEKLAKDTWTSLERMVEPSTGLPRDRSKGGTGPPPKTSGFIFPAFLRRVKWDLYPGRRPWRAPFRLWKASGGSRRGMASPKIGIPLRSWFRRLTIRGFHWQDLPSLPLD